MANTWASGEEFTSDKGNHIGTMWRRYRRGTASTATGTSDVGVIRIDSIPIRGLHQYIIKVMCHPDSTTSTDGVRIQVRYRDDGGSATTANSLLPDATMFVKLGDALYFEAYYSTVTDLTLSLLLCVARASGAGNSSLFADSAGAGNRSTTLAIVAAGYDPGSVGTAV